MYSVLVTDDEPTAVKHIESIIEKKCPDFYVAGRARNGKEALEKTLDIHPDILITDIRMPVMDGIQLSEALYSSGEDTKIIIVSGYSEFGYAQSAIKLGVRDYILKPVVPSELQALLFKLKEELKDKYYQGRKEIIRKLSLGQAPKEGEMEKYFPYALYYAALVRRNGLPPRFSGQRNVEIFSDSNETIFIYGRDECEALYIWPKELVDGNDFIRLIEHKVEKEQPQTAYFTAVYGDEPVPCSRLQELMKKLYRALDCGIVLGKNKVIHLKGEEEDGCGKEPEVQEDGLCGLEKYCMKSNFSRAKEEMIRLLYKWDKEERPQIWVEGMVHKISYILQKYRSGKGWNREEEFLLEDAFLYSENVQQLADNLAEILFKTPEEEADFLKMDTQEYYNKIMKYISGHFAQQLTLQSASRALGISQTYLSKLIRKYGGESFNSCLTRLRMEKAMEIMRTSGSRIYVKDVAEQVGYQDQFYFSRIFRAHTGMCPSDFWNE